MLKLTLTTWCNKGIVHCLFMLVNTLTNEPYCKVLPKSLLGLDHQMDE